MAERYLSEEVGQKIWEVLAKMSIVEREMEKRINERVNEKVNQRVKESVKENLFELLIDAIKEGDSKKSIKRLIAKGDFSEVEIQEAYQKAKE